MAAVTWLRVCPWRRGLGPKQMGCQVGIPQAKPSLGVIAPERGKAAVGFLGEAPAFFGVNDIGQGISHRVEVGRNGQAKEFFVIASIDDDPQICRGYNPHDPTQEAGGTHTAGQGGNT